MSLATDMGGLPLIGGLARFNPATATYPSWAGLSHFWPGPYNRPNASEWGTGLNAASAAQASDRLVVTLPQASSKFTGVVNLAGLPPTPYTIDLAFAFTGLTGVGASTDGLCGIFLYDGTKVKEFSIGPVNSIQMVVIETWTNINTGGTVQMTAATLLTRNLMFLRLCDDGTNRTYRISSNGKDYQQIFSEATNTFLTPTQWGVGGLNNLPVGVNNLKAHVYHALVSTGILGDLP